MDEEDLEEIEQMKAIERMLEDPELRLERVPRYFLKISNSYFMSAYRYYNQDLLKGKLIESKTPNKKASLKEEKLIMELQDELKEAAVLLGSEKKPVKQVFLETIVVGGKRPLRRMNSFNQDDMI